MLGLKLKKKSIIVYSYVFLTPSLTSLYSVTHRFILYYAPPSHLLLSINHFKVNIRTTTNIISVLIIHVKVFSLFLLEIVQNVHRNRFFVHTFFIPVKKAPLVLGQTISKGTKVLFYHLGYIP